MGAVYFACAENSRVYREKNAKNGAWLVISGQAARRSSLALSEAVSDDTLGAVFLFSDSPLSAEGGLDWIISICDDAMQGGRGVLWLCGDNAVARLTLSNALCTSEPFDAQVACALRLNVQNGARLIFDDEGACLRFSDNPPPFSFSNSKYGTRFTTAQVSLCGDKAGVFSFVVGLGGGWFGELLQCGFEFSFEENETLKVLDFPVWLPPYPDAQMRFSLYPCDAAGSGAVFLDATAFQSSFKTLYGERVRMTARENSGFACKRDLLGRSIVRATPMGTYSFSTASGGDIKLLCGLSGTEYLILPQGAKLDFSPGQPAFSPCFPPSGFSIGDFVNPPPASVLTGRFTTSWMKAAGRYYTQPSDSPLFGGNGALLFPADISADAAGALVPVMPYSAYPETPAEYAVPPAQAADFEKRILAKTRGAILLAAPRRRREGLSGVTAATPSGYIAELSGGEFCKIALAFSPKGELAFSAPSDAVCAAFKNSGLFAVLANPNGTGGFTGGISVEDWQFDLKPGSGSKYNEYANILLIKSVTGRIFDPDAPEKSLCANVAVWAQRDLLSAPLVEGKPCPEQLANLSNWLLNYCRDAYEKKSQPCFAHFAGIITDENWQGFLALNMAVGAGGFPCCLQGLLAGAPGDAIRLHHIGSRVTPVAAGAHGPVNDGYSPFFGLVDYVADGFAGDALPPDSPEAAYEFKLLELKALFENGAMKSFESMSQLTLGEFLGVKSAAGALPYNALLLRGALQNSGGAPVLALTSGGGTLIFENAPFQSLAVTGLQMASADPVALRSTFTMSGLLSFPAPRGVDLFSFDALPFSSYALHMDGKAFTPDTSRMRFDLEHAVMREQSLCKALRLTPTGVTLGTKEKQPSAFFYSFLSGEGIQNSLFPGAWAGLTFSAALGSLGSLAGSASLNAKFLLAWDGAGARCAGIALPGAALIENVIGLTMGEARLALAQGVLTLFISGVAVQVMGLLKLPPSGGLTLGVSGGEDGTGWFAAYKK